MVGPLTAGEVRSARAEEKARVESVVKARSTRVQSPKATSRQSAIRKEKSGQKEQRTRPKSDVQQSVSSSPPKKQCSQGGQESSGLEGGRKNIEVEATCKSGAKTVMDTNYGADLGADAEGGLGIEVFVDVSVAVEKKVEARDASAKEQVGADDLSAAVQEDVGAGDKSAAEEEEVEAVTDFSTTPSRVAKVSASDVFNEDDDPGQDVEQQSIWATLEEQGSQGSLQSSPRSTGDRLTAAEVNSDQDDNFSLPSPSKIRRTDSPTQVREDGGFVLGPTPSRVATQSQIHIHADSKNTIFALFWSESPSN